MNGGASGSFGEVFKAINEMKVKGVIRNYAVGGAVAASFYLEPRSTIDVDVFAVIGTAPGSRLISLEPIYQFLKDKGGEMAGPYVTYSQWPIQFLSPTGPLVEEAIEEANDLDVDGVSVRVIDLQHLAAIALQVGRPKDKNRLNDFVESGKMDMEKFGAILTRFDLRSKYEAWRKWKESA